MSVDELFSGALEAAVDPKALLRPVVRWCILAGVMNYTAFIAGICMVFLGRIEPGTLPEPLGRVLPYGALLFSLLAAPGAFVSIWAWIRADETLRKARTGALPAAVGPPAYVARQRAFVLLGVAMVCLLVQMVALQSVIAAASPS